MSSKRILGLAAAATLIAVSAAAQIHDPRAIESDPATAETPIAPALEGLGDHHHRGDHRASPLRSGSSTRVCG